MGSNAMEEDIWKITDVKLPYGEDMEVDDKTGGSKALGLEGLGSKALTTSSDEEFHFNDEFLSKFCREVSVSFFSEYGLISHQINSYNDFVTNGIQKLFDSLGEIIVEPGYDRSKMGEGDEWRYASISFGKVSLDKPRFSSGPKSRDENGEEDIRLLPRHARLQHMTYSARLKAEIMVKVYTKAPLMSDRFEIGKDQRVEKKVQSEEKKNVSVGRIPVMVKSNRCWMNEVDKGDCDFDHGGYFVIKGAEKTFIAQEQRCLKRLWVSEKPNWMVQYQSEIKSRKVYMKLVETSKADELVGGLYLHLHFLTNIPLWILFFALGVSSDKEIIDLIDLEFGNSNCTDILFSTIKDADRACESFDKAKRGSFKGFRKQGKALEIMDELIRQLRFPPEECITDIIDKYLFPTLKGCKQKAMFLGYMVKCLLLSYTQRRKCENRDDFRNKRLELAGELLERELRVHLRNTERRMTRAMQRDLYGKHNLQAVEHYLDASIITNGLCRAFSTGQWCHSFKRSERTSGVVETLTRTNPLQMMSNMRKTRQQFEYTRMAGEARLPNPSHWGKFCFLSTPDGENCGLVKNMAVTGLVSRNLMEPLLDKLLDCGMETLADEPSLTCLKGKVKVMLNGDWVGVCGDSLSFVTGLRSKRRRKEVPHQVEIKRDQQQEEIRIFSDAGRVLRPLLVVDNFEKIKMLKGGYNFQTLMDEGIIELIGVEEEEDCLVAWDIRTLYLEDKVQAPASYTHCELDKSFILGLSCGIIPFVNHDHARRVLYQSQKHSHQAIGFSTTNPSIRVDTLTQQLYYPQRPLFRTMLSDCLGRSEYPFGPNSVVPKPEYFNGQNAIVAVNVHHGYNQEDSLVMNRTSLERGMFRTEVIRSYKAETGNVDAKRVGTKDRVDFGKPPSQLRRVNSLDDDGFPFIGANLQTEDIIIGRCSESGVDHSIKLKHTERGKVQKVVLSADDEGTNFAVVSLRQVRSPSLGDKFSSMHGQKGVIGQLESQENFPFSREGIVPDIVINPHAFPARQTIGQLLEAALGKGIACGGSVRYATPFSTPSFDDIIGQLHRAGYTRWGSEKVCNGENGQLMHSLIFMGPTFYQRLSHMAEDKVKFRNTGPVNPLTRQPVKERKRHGGVKFGEMERDCLLAHGASANLQERFFTLSDRSQMHVCQKCKNIANVILRAIVGGGKIRGPYCRFCESAEYIVKVDVPYAAKLLCQELFCMGICVKFETKQY